VKKKPARIQRADWDALVAAAMNARKEAYAPYSHYRVGAALLARSGAIFAGCNVENATYGATICAERAAVTAMVTAGEREPIAGVVVTAGPRPGAPCGICRQVLSEFAEDMPLLLVAVDGKEKVVASERARLGELLPKAFRLRG
jgi:cytidine deaminase